MVSLLFPSFGIVTHRALNICTSLLHTVPSNPIIKNVSRISASPTMLYVQWDYPNVPNGLILYYSIYCCDLTRTMGESSDSSMVATKSTNLCSEWKVLGNDSETIIHGLLPYTNYTCFVTTNTSAGEGNPSMNLTAQTDETLPADPPANFTAHVLNSTSILLQWSKPTFLNGEILSYIVSISPLDVFILNADTMEYLLTGLEEDTSYTFEIYASTKVGNGPSSKVSVTTHYAPPSAPPESVEVIVTGSKTAAFSWEPPTLEVQNGPLISYILVLSELQFNLSDIEANTTSISYVFTGLQEYDSYSCIIAAVTPAGIGPFSLPVHFVTFEDVPSAPPQHLTGVAESSTVTLSWFPPPSIDINGNLEYYLVTVAETETGQLWTFHAVKPDIIIGSLHPHKCCSNQCHFPIPIFGLGCTTF